MTIKLLTEHHLEFPSLKGDFSGSYESTLVKMPHCWESHVMAYLLYFIHVLHSSGCHILFLLLKSWSIYFPLIL